MAKSAAAESQFHLANGSVLLTECDAGLLDAFRKWFAHDALDCHAGLLDTSAIEDKANVSAICVSVRSPLPSSVLEQFPNVKAIATRSTGYDHIDLASASRREIAVFNVPDYGPAVAEFNIALMLSLTRNVHKAYLQTLQRDFSLAGLRGVNVSGKTLGIIGVGNIGKNVARFAKGLDMRVLGADTQVDAPFAKSVPMEYVQMDRLLAESDFIALCCPLNETTHHLIGKPEFSRMKRGVFIVNTSRGAVIDTQALVWALDQDIVAGAALDVLEHEALLSQAKLSETLSKAAPFEEVQSIAEDLALMKHPKVIVTPHIAFYTEESLRSIDEQSARSLFLYFSGELTDSLTT